MAIGVRLFILLLLAISSADAAAQEIRVRILGETSPTSVEVVGMSGPLYIYAGEYNEPLTELEIGRKVSISTGSDELFVETDPTGLFARSLRVESANGTGIDVRVLEGETVSDLRSYEGRLFVSTSETSREIILVNAVPLEAYVASVVASEYGLGDLEVAKAMAVLARTYALGASRKFGSGYDVVDHTRSQVYRGSGVVTETSRLAALETQGQVLTYEGELVEAVYFASSGGHTADNETVWNGEPLPYLRGKSDPYGAESPNATWNVSISRRDLLEHLGTSFGAQVDGFVIGERSTDGRVETVELLLANGSSRFISGNDFRLLILRRFGDQTLRSALFDVHRDGDKYVFEGRGYGHGVGLSQWGAHEMAQLGKSYAEIISFYFTDVTLASIDPLMPPIEADPIAVAADPVPVEARSIPIETKPDPIEADPIPLKTGAISVAERPLPSEAYSTSERIGW